MYISTAISNHSTLDFTLHYGEQRIVLPGDASWKRLCSSSVPPDDGILLYERMKGPKLASMMAVHVVEANQNFDCFV